MKTKKIVIGAMAAAMLSLSVCSLAPAFAADETVQISVGSTTAEAGGQFKVDVKLSDIPSTGVQGCQFALSFDSSMITIDSVKEGSYITSLKQDEVSSALSSFNTFKNKDSVDVIWASGTYESGYLLQGEGVLCTITGTVASGASGKTEIKVVPTYRETYTGSGSYNDTVDVGYVNKDLTSASYNVEITNGVITIGNGGDDKPTQPSSSEGGDIDQSKLLRGDANVDGKVNMADATFIVQHSGNKDKYKLSAEGEINADVDGKAGVTGTDALEVQKYVAGLIKEL